MEGWDSSKSVALYGTDAWGDGYFGINALGNVEVRPGKNAPPIDLFELVRSLMQRGIQVPVLMRFDGIILDRIQRLYDAFARAREEFNFAGEYCGVFPIKVNQQRHVVDTIRLAGKATGLGLEVGSKPELIAVMAMHDTPDGLLLCNGYKDIEYIELALMARQLGRRSIIIIEQFYELEQTIKIAERLGIDAEIGLRMKPVSRGSGRWESSGGDKAKFGLTASEILSAIELLDKNRKKHWLKLLHFHAGSQITAIAAVKKVLQEVTRMYVEVAKLCPSLCFLDVGGGLAVDYDGSKTNFQSSMNYTLEEYARDVVYATSQACLTAGIPHPNIITESGRALTAHHSVLVFEAIDVATAPEVVSDLPPPPSDHRLLKELAELYQTVNVKNCTEILHDAISARDEVLEQFVQGQLTLTERAYVDKVFWPLVAKIRKVASDLRYLPEDIERLDEQLKDTYFCNFSVFQSIPDAWAIEQLFPFMPIHRLKEQPTRRAILADMTCDSDGKIEHFIDLKDISSSIKLHPLKNGDAYYIGVFLVGAYQEILGDLHNLFGDTNAVHVSVSANGEIEFTHVVEGDTVREALGYVQYDVQDLTERLRVAVEKALRDGTLNPEDSAKLQKRYREALEGYTYLYVER